jgi:hypothetical protein
MSLVNSVVSYGDARLLVTGENPSDCVCLLLSSEKRVSMNRVALCHGEVIRLPLASVHKIADSLEEYTTDERERRRAHKLRRTVCENEAGVKGVVTSYEGGSFFGRALLNGNPWKSKNPKKIADSLYAYTETLIAGE